MSQKNLLRILFVEDVPSDVDLAVLELRKEKLVFEYLTVCTRDDLIHALNEFRPDIIISDYMMPSFNGLQALKTTKELYSDIPFILYTGSVNEETAVECIKAGAEDYVIKEHMTRLPFAVKEALEQVSINKEKKASELLLKENEEKLQSIFSAAPVGIGLVVNRVLIEVNDSLCRMIGYNRSELIGQSSLILYNSKEEYERVGKEKYGQIARKGIGSVETQFKCKDGSILNVILGSTPLDLKDHSKGVTFTVLDITERKKSEEALKESQHLFQTLSQVSPVGIFRTRSDGYTTYVNPEWLELAGLKEEEGLGFGWLKAVHPDDRAHIEARWQTDVQNKSSSVAEYRFLRSDGTIVWVMGNAVPEMKNNVIEGYIGTITDITERKKTEIALRESENKYRRIFENVQDVYFETSLDGTILEVSPSINNLSKGQYKMSELVGKSMNDFYINSSDRQQVLAELKEKGFVSDFEVLLKNRDDMVMPCSISAKLIFESSGIPDKIIGSVRDITDRKNASDALKLAKEKAETSDKLKTDFLNNISHEVRTPLNGILGFAEIITLQDLTDEEKKDSLAMLSESSNRLLNTITNYMDISLITSGSLTLNKKEFSPTKILKKLLNNYNSVCLNRNLELVLEIDHKSDDHILNSDPEICQKILSHFLDNAIKFTEKGSISFGFTERTEQLEFYVRDTGIGINTQSFNIIFDRFSKENLGPYKVSEGSGLGLSIARGMADAIGGKIRLESEPGVGSCFYLSIPVKDRSGKFQGESIAVKLSNNKSESLILIAEDDETNFYYLNALLIRETGAKIIHASNGGEAVDLFKATPGINLILMDIKMPLMDGFEATRQIKLVNPSIPIIAITAYAMSGDEDRIIAAGCDGYLSKPINKTSLLEKIAEFVVIDKSPKP
jgi:PAS domain S-box-containing protein